jgi:hypothetical protein
MRVAEHTPRTQSHNRVRVYRAHLSEDSASGVVENVESGETRPFQNLNERLTILVKSPGREAPEQPVLTPPDTESVGSVPGATIALGESPSPKTERTGAWFQPRSEFRRLCRRPDHGRSAGDLSQRVSPLHGQSRGRKLPRRPFAAGLAGSRIVCGEHCRRPGAPPPSVPHQEAEDCASRNSQRA